MRTLEELIEYLRHCEYFTIDELESNDEDIVKAFMKVRAEGLTFFPTKPKGTYRKITGLSMEMIHSMNRSIRRDEADNTDD